MADELVMRHHREQKLIARNAIAELHPLWRILDFNDLRGSTADWLKAVRPVVEKGYLTSQYVAAEFVKSYRRAVLPAADQLLVEVPNPLGVFGNPIIPDRNTQIKIMVAMKVTGPVHVAKLMPMDQQEAMDKGFSKSTGAAIRLILNGGRGMVRLLADADPMARGVVGVADEDACEPCKSLTTPILKSRGRRQMDAVAVGHDFCGCSAALVY